MGLSDPGRPLCGTSPALRVNDELYEDLNLDKVDRLLDQISGRTGT